MAAEGANVNQRRNRNERDRRCWNQDEEEALLGCLKELVSTGWKSDNGFRGGYLHKLQDMMSAQFPQANIQATPHIASKLNAWKKNYDSLVTILSRSGIGFNVHADYKVDCDNEQWEQLYNVDANAKNICGKSWPYYEQWCEIFGKDRANGQTAEDVIDAVNDLIVEDRNHAANIYMEDFTVELDDLPDTPNAEKNSCQSGESREASTSRSQQRKRKAINEADKNLCDMLGKMQQDTNTRLESISHRIGYASDLGKARKEIFAMLEVMPELSSRDKFKVSDILLDQPQRLEFFIALAAHSRLDYALHLIEG